MSSINITKTDVIWSYIAQFFGLCSNIIILPFILTHLSTDVIAIWTIFFSVSTMVVMLDIGFQEAFARNVAYVYGGMSVLKKEGIANDNFINNDSSINYSLLKSLIITMRKFYGLLVLIILIILFIPGTFYINYLSKGLLDYKEILYSWIIYSISLGISFYCIMYNALLQGKGYFKEFNILKIISKLIYLVLIVVGMSLGYGIITIAVANLISMIAYKLIAPLYVNKDKMYDKLKDILPSKDNLLRVIGYNAIRSGIAAIILNFTTRSSPVFFPLFVPSLTLTAQYGISIQIVGLISNLSLIYGITHVPLMAQYRVDKNSKGLKNKFGETIALMSIIFFIGTICTLFFGNYVFELIGSNTKLLSTLPLLFLFIIFFLDTNHSLSIGFISTGNYIPHLKSTIIIGICIIACTFLFTKVFGWGLYGFIFSIGVCQLYHNFRWPLEVTRELKCSYTNILFTGYRSILSNLIKVK